MAVLKNCLSDAINITRNSDKSKLVYGDYRKVFDVADSWRSRDNFANIFVNFDVGNCSSSHMDNPRNEFLVLGKGQTFDNNGELRVCREKV